MDDNGKSRKEGDGDGIHFGKSGAPPRKLNLRSISPVRCLQSSNALDLLP